MKKNNPIVKIAVFGVIAVILWGVGFFTKLWDLSEYSGGNHLEKKYIQIISIEAQSTHGCLYTADIAMVVCAPNVNQLAEATLKLILVISNIRS